MWTVSEYDIELQNSQSSIVLYDAGWKTFKKLQNMHLVIFWISQLQNCMYCSLNKSAIYLK